jgi:putative heme-binding domain-containing protein
MRVVLTLGLALSAAVSAIPAALPPAPLTAEDIGSELKTIYPHNKVFDPAEEAKQFLVHPDFEVNLFASSPWVINPVAMAWDEHNRLWVVNAPTYPHILPGQRNMDFVSVLEDTKGVGRADKCTIFYDKLNVPTGIELGDGGAYVANQPDLLFLRDTRGGLHCDRRQVLLSGFGTEDNHHAINAFRWGPGGWLYFMSGVFLHTQVETPHGLVRLVDGGTFQLRPREQRLELFNVGTATNPWGLAFDRWGQSFLTEGPQGGIWYLTPGTVSSRPGERVPGTDAPKACGNEFIESRHFSDQYQRTMALNAFKNKTVNLYRFSDDGAGYATREIQPLLVVSREPYFRPVDVKLGPDGALYVADFFQEIIGHMQYEFRDPRRDHLNGRIWRITQKGHKPLPRPWLADLPLDELVGHLKSPDSFERDKTRRVLYERSAGHAGEVASALNHFVHHLDPHAPQFEHHRLEVLWAYQTIDVPQPRLLTEVLRSSEPHARAAAVCVLRYWLPKLGYAPVPGDSSGMLTATGHESVNALELLAERITDGSPRVRLEALCTLSYLASPRAMELASQAVDQRMDRFLDYAFRHTALALKKYWLPALEAGHTNFGGNSHRLQAALAAVNSLDAAAILLKMVRSGRIASGGCEGVLTLAASVGGPAELAELFEPASFAALVSPYDPALHAHVLEALTRTMRERHVKPAGDLTRLKQLARSDNLALRAEAFHLAAAWKLEALRPEVAAAAKDDQAALSVRRAAIEALAELGGEPARVLLRQLASVEHSRPIRLAASAGLARLDLAGAAYQVAEILTTDPASEDPATVLEAILSRKGGAEALTAALVGKKPHPDAARLALRYMNSTGHQAEGLVRLLAACFGAGTLTRQLAAEDLHALIADVRAKGDPCRGEEVFRRKDLTCMSCHAIAGGGPPVGPDLEGIGASSPMDYIVESVLYPNKAVREGYAAVKVFTDSGKVYHGILVSRNGKDVIIRDAATRQLLRIPGPEIDQVVDAPSIMPQGLIDSLTRAEFLDLARFVSELGRPGPFATPNIPTIRTWRVLDPVPSDLADSTPPDQGRLSREGLAWQTVYSKVSGELPLADMGRGPVAYVQSRIDVGTPGKVRLHINSPAGLNLWVDSSPVPVTAETLIDVEQGVRILTFRIDCRKRQAEGLRVRLEDAPGSPGRARVLNGP